MIVNKFTYWFNEPDRFDIVVFHATMKNDFIKRVIGLPGEHVAVEDQQLYIDGEKIAEPYLKDRKSTRLNSSHVAISYAVFCLKKKKNKHEYTNTITT